MQPRVVREIHHAHAAAAEDALDAIGADLRARRRAAPAARENRGCRRATSSSASTSSWTSAGSVDARTSDSALGRRRRQRAIEQRADALPSIRVRSSAFAFAATARQFGVEVPSSATRAPASSAA